MANTNNPQSVIPDVEYNVEGDFVTVPVPEGADAGKVLGAISEGHVGWVEDQGAGVIQQQSDWTETDDTKVTYIQHKPANLVQDADYVHTDNNFTDADSAKLEGIAAGAEVNVQSNWNESDSSSDAFIANKPTQKPVVAGANISIVDGQDAVTISATVPTVDQTYNSSSTNAQSGVAVAEAISGVNQVPASTSADADKVLTVDSQGVPGWATPSAPSGGDSDEWWGGEPEKIELSRKQIRLLFRDTTYDPRNDSDTTFLNRFDSITKEADGSYTFQFKTGTLSVHYARAAFNGKYLADNEFVVLAWNPRLKFSESVNYDNYEYMFYGCTGLRAVYNVDNTSYTQSTNCANAFYGCTNLVVYKENTYTISNSGSHVSESYYIDNGQGMFNGCTSLKEARMLLMTPMSTITSSMNLSYQTMFSGCTKLEIGPCIWGAPKTCSQMFLRCRNLREFSKYGGNFSSPELGFAISCDCNSMFGGCFALASLDGLSNFFARVKISNVGQMFSNCSTLQNIPFHLNLVTTGIDGSNMFYNMSSLTSVPSMDFENLIGVNRMFQGCTVLRDISPLATVTWNASLTDVTEMFDNCRGIQKGLKDVYDNMAATATITTHSNTFHYCGMAFGNPDLAQIPASWGGTGA